MANPSKTLVRTGSFGAFGQAANHQVMAGFANYFTTEDAAASPLKSPLATVSNSVPVGITIPAAAISVKIKTDQKLRVSEDAAMGQYDTIAAGAEDTYPCVSPLSDNILSNTGVIYIRSDTTAANVSFKFNCV